MKIGTVYKISSPQTPKFYIGSTSQKLLSTRLSQHKHCLKKGKELVSKHIVCFPDAIIEPLCCMKFTNRSELHAIEYQVMKQYGDQVVNHIGIQDSYSKEYKNNYCKEYLRDPIHKQKHNNIMKAQHQKNKDQIHARKNTVVNCDHCDKHYTKANKSAHMKRYHNLYRI